LAAGHRFRPAATSRGGRVAAGRGRGAHAIAGGFSVGCGGCPGRGRVSSGSKA
jgi:hypothetical protein